MFTPAELIQFKSLCGEGDSIAAAFEKHKHKFRGDILDVGTGPASVPTSVFSDRRALLLDVQDYSPYLRRLPPGQRFVRSDFFAVPAQYGTCDTVLFIHSIGFLTKDIAHFNAKLDDLHPQSIGVVINQNVGALADVIAWGCDRLQNIYPELTLGGVAPNYKIIEKESFHCDLAAKDFAELAWALGNVFGRALIPGELCDLEAFLRGRLSQPCLRLDQALYVYERGNHSELG
jgi:hypothetical protein